MKAKELGHVRRVRPHSATQSIYVFDPDDHEVEVFVDADPAIWRDNPAAVLAPIKPLRL